MGARFSRANRRPLYASEATDEAVPTHKEPAAPAGDKAPAPVVGGRVAAPPAPLRLSPAPSIPEDDLCVRVQLQESFSPAQAIHLILLPTDRQAQGELSHRVADWMAPGAGADEERVNSPKSPKQPKSPRSPRSPNSPKGRLMGRLSPRRRPQSPAAAAAAPPTA